MSPRYSASTNEDYAHFNEEASIVKSHEDRYADYYADEPGDDFYDEWE